MVNLLIETRKSRGSKQEDVDNGVGMYGYMCCITCL
jgi:hypothetical protein